MFALSNPHQQRTHPQPDPHSVSYHQPDYYPPNNSSPHLSSTPHEKPSRPYGVHSRADLYPNTGDQLYLTGGHSGNINPHVDDNVRDSLSPAAHFDHSYVDHSTLTSSDLHIHSDGLHQGHRYHTDSSNVIAPTSGLLTFSDVPDALDDFALTSSHSNFPLEPSVTGGPASENSGDSDFWFGHIPDTSLSDQSKPKKSRREKPHIELAPDQPPTTQGKPRARVYVACVQCRTRKIRCDGAKPVCHNCGRRTNQTNDCNYDPIPKRRGPDKTPGARQRMARDVRNEIDSGHSRRRRRIRDSTRQMNQHPTPASSVIDLPQVCGPVSETHIPLPISPDASTGDFFSVSDYTGSHDIPCSCHGIAQCRGLVDAGALSESRNLVSSKSIYNAKSVLTSVSPPYSGYRNRGYITLLDENGHERQDSGTPEIACEPSLIFSRKVWWDSLLSLYSSPPSSRVHTLTVSQRETAAQSITGDLRFIFRSSNYWFSFFHIPSFFGNFFDSTKREKIQPSLILALLAMSTFWQSSEVGHGKQGRERALRFRDEAQSAMDASFNAGWIDETLAQAAWLLALFEVCAHPRHSSQRASSSMVMLDSIIRSLSLTLVDADDPNTTMFSPGTVPVVDPKSRTAWFPVQPQAYRLPESCSSDPLPSDEVGCSCHNFTLEEHWPSTVEYAPLWSSTPAWGDSWTEAEIRKESSRRLCWSSIVLAAGHSSYTTAHHLQGLDLFIADPANYALLFSGESVARSPASASHSSKDAIWALHDRSFLLWHGCTRMRGSTTATDDDKAQFAMKAWLEADGLERALNRHTCSIERAFIFQAREYIFNTRMCISYEFQRYIPLVTANVSGLFHRTKAEEWLTHQATVAERFMYGLHTVTGNSNNLLARRPFFVFWFMGQIHRALTLWECDKTLSVALDVCKALVPAIDYLTALWPCPEQRYRYESLRKKVASACFDAGIEPPREIDLSYRSSTPPVTLI